MFMPRVKNEDFFEDYKCLDAKSIDLFLADPPYNLFENTEERTGVRDPEINIEKLDEALDHLVTANGTVLLFCNLDLLYKFIQGLDHFEFRWEYIAYKSNGMPCGPTRPLHNLEYVAVFKRKSAKATEMDFYPYESGIVKDPYCKKNNDLNHSTRKMEKREYDINETGKRYVKQSIKMAAKCNLPEKERTQHPFQKPVDILRTLIRVHSSPQAMVCDGFSGVGSTLVAAQMENRRAIGFEIDNKWVEVARNRIGKQNVKIEV